jgi:hypothetical protein
MQVRAMGSSARRAQKVSDRIRAARILAPVMDVCILMLDCYASTHFSVLSIQNGQEFTQNFGAEMLNARRIRALRSSTNGHGSFRTRLLQRSSIVPPEAHYKAHGPRVSHSGSLFFNKIRRPPARAEPRRAPHSENGSLWAADRDAAKKVGKLLKME